MLSHQQGSLLNAAALARALAVHGKTVTAYLELLVELLLFRRLPPWHGNVCKRLIKSPKVDVRDSGLVHALLGIGDHEALLAHPVAGGRWEGLAIESLIAAAPGGSEACFFLPAAGAEIDLLLKLPGERKPWAIEIKRGFALKLERRFLLTCDTVKPAHRRVVYGESGSPSAGGCRECLSLEWFRNRIDVSVVIEDWWRHYDETRPHSSLVWLTPAEFKQLSSKSNPEEPIFRE